MQNMTSTVRVIRRTSCRSSVIAQASREAQATVAWACNILRKSRTRVLVGPWRPAIVPPLFHKNN